MGLIDIAVVSALALMAGWPWIASAIAVASPITPRSAAPAVATAEDSHEEGWRQTWVSTLIDLIDQLEAGELPVENEQLALKLSKELLWEIIGGDGPQPSKSK